MKGSTGGSFRIITEQDCRDKERLLKMSQKMSEKTRRGRASTGAGAGAATMPAAVPVSPAKTDKQPTVSEAEEEINVLKGEEGDQMKMTTVGSQTDSDGILESILERLEAMDGKSKSDKEYKKKQTEHMANMTKYMEQNQAAWKVHKRKLLISEQQLKVANDSNKRLEVEVNALENQLRVCNLCVEGKREVENEDMLELIMDLAKQVGEKHNACRHSISE